MVDKLREHIERFFIFAFSQTIVFNFLMLREQINDLVKSRMRKREGNSASAATESGHELWIWPYSDTFKASLTIMNMCI